MLDGLGELEHLWEEFGDVVVVGLVIGGSGVRLIIVWKVGIVVIDLLAHYMRGVLFQSIFQIFF